MPAFSVHDGRDQYGNFLCAPYPHDAFDILVVVWNDGGVSHFWRIPATELTARGYLSTPTQDGKINFKVHGPIGPQPNPSARRKADTWTQDYYVGNDCDTTTRKEFRLPGQHFL